MNRTSGRTRPGKQPLPTNRRDGQFLQICPLGFYDKQGNYTPWQTEFASDSRYSQMVSRSLLTAYDRETFRPWVMFNFRLTKEIGRIVELSFTANNFTRTSRWHYYDTRTGYKQIYPDMYFGARTQTPYRQQTLILPIFLRKQPRVI